MLRVLASSAVRELDGRAAQMGVAPLLLMESAGSGSARAVQSWDRDLACQRVLAVCGTGGNGGDALSAARWLGLWGADPRAVVVGVPKGPAADQAAAFQASFPGDLFRVEHPGDVVGLEAWLEESDLVLDGILGLGLSGEARGLARVAIAAVNAARRPVVAMDLPSGLDADTGRTPGAAVRADLTLAMGAFKPCHLLPPAAELCGEVRVVNVGYPPHIWADAAVLAKVLEHSDVQAMLPARSPFGHKGTFGKVLVVGGSVGMAGAAALAAEGALRSGAGLVHALTPESVGPVVAGLIPEALVHPGPSEGGMLSPEAGAEAVRWAQEMDVVVVGPGLGRGPGPTEVVRSLVRSGARLVLDADALFALAQEPDLLPGDHGELILTPHSGEFGRLVGKDPDQIVPEKIRWAREGARTWKGVVVLKGPPTAVADPEGEVCLNTTGNTALAHGGSGDVLAGMIGGLWAGGARSLDAACAATFVHGRAAELLVQRGSARAALPSDLLVVLLEAFAEIEG